MSRLAYRFLTPVLYLHAILVVVLAIVLFFLHVVPLTQDEPIFATRIGDLYLAFALLLVLVAWRYRQDPLWLAIPIFFTLAEFLNAAVQTGLRLSGSPLLTDPQPVQPLIFNFVFLVYYILAFTGRHPAVRSLVTRPSAKPQSSDQAPGEETVQVNDAYSGGGPPPSRPDSDMQHPTGG